MMFPQRLGSVEETEEYDGHRGSRRGRLLNELVWSLNWMHGKRGVKEPRQNPVTEERNRRLRGDVLHRGFEAVAEMDTMLCARPGEDCLCELLKGRSPYSQAGPSASIAPYEESRLSVPTSLIGTPFVEDLLSEEDAYFF